MKPALLIIAESEDWIAINKPAGLLSIPDREGKEISLKEILKGLGGEIYTVHRLDRETSGLIVFARNESAHKELSRQFEGRDVKKIYRGLVTGSLREKEGSIDQPVREHSSGNGTMIVHPKGKPSLTDYKVLKDFGKFSLIEFRIHTGRTHQIRVHMKSIGHPIACDPIYGDGKPLLVSSIRRSYKLSRNEESEKPILSRLALHSFQLGFTDIDGTPRNLEAEIPKDIRATVAQLEKAK